MSKVELLQGDCMDYMRSLPDGAFELAIVDPPYGIGMSGGNVGYKGLNNLERKEWDREIPRLNELGGEGWMLVDKEGITFIFAREGVHDKS